MIKAALRRGLGVFIGSVGTALGVIYIHAANPWPFTSQPLLLRQTPRSNPDAVISDEIVPPASGSDRSPVVVYRAIAFTAVSTGVVVWLGLEVLFLRRLQTEQQLRQQVEAEREQVKQQLQAAEAATRTAQQQVNELWNEIDTATAELSQEKKLLKQDNETLKHQLEQLYERIHQLEAEELNGEADDFEPDSRLQFLTVAEALTLAAEHFPILEVWDSARASVYEINHYLPDKVYQSLSVLAEVGAAFFEHSVHTDLDEVFRNKGVRYSPRESQMTMGKHGHERNFWHRGQQKQMVRHLRVGRRLRIYFDFDQDQQKVQIGYCGKHLRTVTG